MENNTSTPDFLSVVSTPLDAEISAAITTATDPTIVAKCALSTLALAGLPKEIQGEAFAWQAALLPLLATKKNRGAQLEAIAQVFRVSVKTAERKFYRFKTGGLSGLVDRRAAGADFWQMDERVGLSEYDQNLVKEYCERYQRNNEAAIRALRADWQSGIVTTTTEFKVGTSFPLGWSERNLARFAPNEFELAVARQGRSAASSKRPLVYMTRRDLYVGQFYLFDDIWHDHEVNLMATKQRGRPLEFHGLDLSSAYKIGWGMRVRRKVDGVNESLKTTDFRFLLHSILSTVGFNPRGTTLVVEHGTTVIDEHTERLLALASVTPLCPEGAIRVERSGMQGAAAHAGQYAGRAKGNFRIKAALESLGSLMHNEFAALPGQTGKDRDSAPEGQLAMQKHNDALLMALAELTPERAQWLRFPILSFSQFQLVAQEIYARINARTKHDLEGWDLRLVPDQYGGMRKLSPTEVWNQGSRDLVKLRPEVAAMILGTDGGKERAVRNHQISFTSSEISGDPLRFDAHRLAPRSTYLCVLNPFDTDRLICYNAKGRYIATLARMHSADRGNVEAVHRACGDRAKIETALLAPIRVRQMKAARDKLAMHSRNTAVLRGEPISDEEKLQAAVERSRVTDMRDFLPAPELLSDEELSGESDWTAADDHSAARLVSTPDDFGAGGDDGDELRGDAVNSGGEIVSGEEFV